MCGSLCLATRRSPTIPTPLSSLNHTFEFLSILNETPGSLIGLLNRGLLLLKPPISRESRILGDNRPSDFPGDRFLC